MILLGFLLAAVTFQAVANFTDAEGTPVGSIPVGELAVVATVMRERPIRADASEISDPIVLPPVGKRLHLNP